jgi:D-aspartate ligase
MTPSPSSTSGNGDTKREATGWEEIGALVIGGEHPGLGIARSLGRRGIPVVVIDDQHSISSYSRYVRRVIRVPNLRDERATVDAVMDAGRRHNLKNWVLYPTRDETVAAFSRYHSELDTFFRVTTPEWDVVKWAWDKKQTYELAEKLDIPCPGTFTVQSAAELPSLYSKLPLAVKPAVKEHFFYATGAKAWRANTVEELHHLFSKANEQIPVEEILLQEIIPGDGSTQFSYCAFFRDSAAHSVLLARRERQHPREFGRAATYVETVDLPVIVEPSERFLKFIKFYGLVEVEFKRDPRDNRYKLLDINARTWGFHCLGLVSGVDFPYLLFADQTGRPAASCRAVPGVAWIRWITDLPVALSSMLTGHLGIKSYVRSLRRVGCESVFAKDDPLPSVAEIFLLPYLIAKKYLWKQ